VGFIIFFLHVVAELWFWIYLIPIRIQHFNWIGFRIQGFESFVEPKLKKKIELKKTLIFSWSKVAIYLSLGLL
jgi:hypothetical protein